MTGCNQKPLQSTVFTSGDNDDKSENPVILSPEIRSALSLIISLLVKKVALIKAVCILKGGFKKSCNCPPKI